MELRRHEPGPERPSAPPDISSLWERLEEGANVPLSVQTFHEFQGVNAITYPRPPLGAPGGPGGPPFPFGAAQQAQRILQQQQQQQVAAAQAVANLQHQQ